MAEETKWLPLTVRELFEHCSDTQVTGICLEGKWAFGTGWASRQADESGSLALLEDRNKRS